MYTYKCTVYIDEWSMICTVSLCKIWLCMLSTTYNYYKAESHLSVCLSTLLGMLITQSSKHWLKTRFARNDSCIFWHNWVLFSSFHELLWSHSSTQKAQLSTQFRQNVLPALASWLHHEMNYQTVLLSRTLRRMNYQTVEQLVLITLLWMIGSFKDFCRKFFYKLTVSGKSFVWEMVVVFALFSKQCTRILLSAW